MVTSTMAATATCASLQQAFEQYVRSTSWIRMFIVCALTMGPPFGSFLLTELIPLKDPSAGWAANWVFWIRTFLNNLCLTTGASIQVRSMAHSAPFTAKKLAIVIVSTSIGNISVLVLLGKFWVFPIPFTEVTGTMAWMSSFWLSVLTVLGLQRTIYEPAVKKQFLFCALIIMMEGSLMTIYSAYSCVFAVLKGVEQALFTIMLPVIKSCMKKIMIGLSGHSDTTLMLVKATVDIFEALFVFKCMQAATSWIAVLALVLVDFLQSLLHVHSFYRFNQQDMRLASFKQKISHLSSSAVSRVVSSTQRLASIRMSPMPAFKKHNSVAPTVVAVVTAAKRGSQTNVRDPHLLFFLHCREILLIKFIECAITSFYLVYFAALFHLHNAKYYPEMKHMTVEKMHSAVGSIGTYALMQTVTLLMMHWFLKRRFNLSALHVLAFTLENRSVVLHGTFLMWVHVVLQLTIQHNGTGQVWRGQPWMKCLLLIDCFVGFDPTFRFDWM